eukprot:GHVH01000722.1.p1 GENE.GHVH01000722.1~~GHVH01000722.1.p1  ORF type:complete len:492 (+),score=56.25 GHVH01000722.1:879-2354(+)
MHFFDIAVCGVHSGRALVKGGRLAGKNLAKELNLDADTKKYEVLSLSQIEKWLEFVLIFVHNKSELDLGANILDCLIAIVKTHVDAKTPRDFGTQQKEINSGGLKKSKFRDVAQLWGPLRIAALNLDAMCARIFGLAYDILIQSLDLIFEDIKRPDTEVVAYRRVVNRSSEWIANMLRLEEFHHQEYKYFHVSDELASKPITQYIYAINARHQHSDFWKCGLHKTGRTYEEVLKKLISKMSQDSDPLACSLLGIETVLNITTLLSCVRKHEFENNNSGGILPQLNNKFLKKIVPNRYPTDYKVRARFESKSLMEEFGTSDELALCLYKCIHKFIYRRSKLDGTKLFRIGHSTDRVHKVHVKHLIENHEVREHNRTVMRDEMNRQSEKSSQPLNSEESLNDELNQDKVEPVKAITADFLLPVIDDRMKQSLYDDISGTDENGMRYESVICCLDFITRICLDRSGRLTASVLKKLPSNLMMNQLISHGNSRFA